ncbi:MAG: DUF3326 domain-containing protein [Candidatus Caenarcaniphilales bacterium]|nr:DUF3326 domain-containing protein [Candidatus Caenarcaniphilales bacterium]
MALLRFRLDQLIGSDIERLISAQLNHQALLRWGGVGIDSLCDEVLIEVFSAPRIDFFPDFEEVKAFAKKKIGALIIPTGLGCSVGGFGGDATQIAHQLAPYFDYLLVNPNVLNAGAWFNPPTNALYVEGYALDRFLAGDLGLRVLGTSKNKLGVIFDAGIPEPALIRELEIIKAAQLIYGLEIVGIEYTSTPLKPKVPDHDYKVPLSFTWHDFSPLDSPAERLVSKGAEALACITLMPETEDSAYLSGAGFDPIGGLEAQTSHYLSARYHRPCAHAPAFEEITPNITSPVDQRVSPEITSFSFLPSVLIGLHRSPKLIPSEFLQEGDLSNANLEIFAYPADCCLGRSINLANQLKNCRVYAINSNQTGIGLNPELLNLKINTLSDYAELVCSIKVQKDHLIRSL